MQESCGHHVHCCRHVRPDFAECLRVSGPNLGVPGSLGAWALLDHPADFAEIFSDLIISSLPTNFLPLILTFQTTPVSSDSTFKHQQATTSPKLFYHASPSSTLSVVPQTAPIFLAVPTSHIPTKNRVTTSNTRLSMYSCFNAFRNHPPLTLQPFPIPRKPCSLYARSNG